MCHSYTCHGPVAQWSEQGTHNPLVVGSIPTGPTMFHLFFIALLESHFVRFTIIITFFILYIFAKNPREDFYKEPVPRYNLNQDDVDIIIEALNKRADISWIPKEQDRIRRLILRLKGKIDALNANVNTQPIQKQEDTTTELPIVYDDQVWSFYNNDKD